MLKYHLLRTLELEFIKLHAENSDWVTVNADGKYHMESKNELQNIKSSMNFSSSKVFYVPNVKRSGDCERLPDNCQFQDIKNMRAYIRNYLYNFHDIS